MLGLSKVIRALAGKSYQYRVNIPKKIAEELNLKGDGQLLWKVDGKKISLEVDDE